MKCLQERKHDYEIFYWAAMDVLPMQASSVPCERIFSSSKETDTLRRSQLSAEMMEMLQMLKFQFRSERLDFNNNWVSSEGDLSVMDISPEVVEGMISDQRISDLDELIDSSFT
ncbi:hypothetical protein K443DRAFT_112663 [Laccaria amethystina LaAM-08-1]|uniref:HAT C-terminal dimerisation domain-containing protein n=1 Tax=Laccaria amethystina LaAM-08-1 TaxID=1095629 RepID=A0A0C9X5Z2_9AGAR|nr:hypothetical protein K443DRAFT_112663 [Laccaria amethystina LaAM-08-1]